MMGILDEINKQKATNLPAESPAGQPQESKGGFMPSLANNPNMITKENRLEANKLIRYQQAVEIKEAAQTPTETKQASANPGLSTPGGAIARPEMVDFSAEDHQKFQEALDNLRSSFEHPEMVTGAIRNILTSLKLNPEYKKILLPEDFGLMVRTLRQSTQQVVTSKLFTKDKTSEKKKKVAKLADDFANMMDMDMDTTGMISKS